MITKSRIIFLAAVALSVSVGSGACGAELAPKVTPLAASGGDVVFDIVADGDIPYRVHVFTNTGPAMLTVSNGGFVDCLIVGGGGGGGETIGGGGGGGGVLDYQGLRVTAGDYAVTVGAGGAGGWGSGYPAGSRGSDSLFGGWTAVGGGAGAGYNLAASGTGGSAGGNGGGGGARAGFTLGQGSDGGIHWNNNAAGGGGGAGATGAGASAAGGGKGGDGRASAITGATVYYSGGGGGGTRHTAGIDPGMGGLGGGGDGGRTTMGQEGTATTGGGGGGGGYVGELAGGRGGSGIVIVRYSLGPMTLALPVTLADPATGSEEFTNTNGVRIADIPVYAGYDQFQCTGENRSVQAIDPDGWISTNSLSSFYATFTPPVADTNITLYVWFTNTTDSAMPLLRSPGSITFTSANPVPALRALTRYLVEGASTVAVGFAELDAGTTGGMTGETPIPIFGYGLTCANDITPNAPELTFNQAGTFDIVLTVTNAAGNVAATTNPIDIQNRTLTLYVSRDGDNTGAPSWSGAYTNIQTALDAAVAGDTIHLAGELFGVTNQIDWTTPGITIRGGYEASETDPAKLPGTNNPALWPTVIARQSGITRLIFINGASNSTLEQVTLTGGNADTGNGLRINNSLNVLLSGCSISNNVSTGSGTGGRGGGIYAIASGLTLTNCLVIGNGVKLATSSSSSVYGGGIYSEGGSLSLYDSKILNNDATCWSFNRGDGGGVYCSGTVKMKNVLLAGNLANRSGGGICVIGGTASLENCTITDNLETGLQRTGGTVSLINSIVWGHPIDIVGASITVSYSAVGVPGYDGVNGNIGEDPLFEYGYHLAAGSPCIGKGSDSAGNLGLAAYTTRTDGAPYASGDATVTMGYHQLPGTVFDQTYADVYVSLAGDDSNSGTLATAPFRTMTKALAVARDGTRVNVATGRYQRAVGVTAGEAFPLKVENRVGVQIIGTDATQTVIDAIGSGARVMDLICSHRVAMTGVTVTGGSVSIGAGLRVDRCLGVSLSDVTIADNIYHGNAGGAGGGIWAESSSMTLADCTVRSNSVTAWTLSSSRAFGGGVWFRYGRLTMRNCSILGNKAYNLSPGWAYGGGVHRDGNAVLDLRNVLFAGNSVAGDPTRDHGAGLYTAASGSVLMENCTVTDNTLGGIRCDSSPFTMLNSIVWGNGTYDLSGTYTSVRFSDVGTAGYAGVNDNISADPIFKDAAKGDYRLLLGSPAVDKGQLQDWMDDAVDLDGNPRVSMAGVDMGAYELPAPAGTVILIR